ncbi:(2Fe-2S) ferredoxin domain-containing protein [Bacillus massiliigorillae]|uniref:(2Fe-2S) ferredoxin domain-containing protein n=1 Tax=Bacillus massiliigorillae TaxID=1243664 RepID=UPI0003A2E7C9|nr:(2Fe-2S) ferredoxin domain-containing protein [Bacillus massiliigorillae]
MTTWNLNGTCSHLFMCNGSSCNRKDAEEVTLAIRDEITKLGLDDKIHTTRTRCNGRCKDAPVVIEYPKGNWYGSLTADVGREIVRTYNQAPLREYVSYEVINGEMTRNEEYTAIKGISKKK